MTANYILHMSFFISHFSLATETAKPLRDGSSFRGSFALALGYEPLNHKKRHEAVGHAH